KGLQVPARGQRTASLFCPASAAAAGAGFDLAPGRQAVSSFPGTRLSVRGITAGVRSFSFTVRNSGRTARRVVLAGSCLTVVSRPHAVRRRLHVKLMTFALPVDPGRRAITRACPGGWFSFAARYGSQSPAVAVEAAAVDRGGRWLVANSSDASAQVELQLACG